MRIIFLILSLFITINVFSQEIDTISTETNTESVVFNKENLPQYFIQNGDTIGVILTVKQLQILDNNTDLLELFEKKGLKCDSLDSYYVAVIDEQDRKIHIQEVKIENLNQQLDNQKSQINNLKQQVASKILELDLATQQLDNKDEIIEGLKKDLNKANTQKIIGWSATGVAATAAIVLGIFFGTR